ncbi:MAG: hypothetical protein JWL95_2995 [Gemmatimonadetes bacterium]|nr:hypothetical protein [Gemmatimonadota bacterium]
MQLRDRNVLRALQEDTSVLERFWAQVDVNDSESGCWEWSGHLRHHQYPTLFVGSYSIAATRVAWFTATGELPAGGRVRHACDNPHCVRPEHLAWTLGRTSQRRIDVLGDGYLSASGVPIESVERSLRPPRVIPYVSESRRIA